MPATVQNNFRTRKSFAKIQKIIDIPNLINIQKQSYEKFLQADVAPDKREDVGLQGVFKSVFPSVTSTRRAPWSSSATTSSGRSTTSTSATSGG
jgi:DNA-directed RNA polymerase beta subunit